MSKTLSSLAAILALSTVAAPTANAQISIYRALDKVVSLFPQGSGFNLVPISFQAADLLTVDGHLVWKIGLVRGASSAYDVDLDAYTGAALRVAFTGHVFGPQPNVILSQAARLANTIVGGLIVGADLKGSLGQRFWAVVIETPLLGKFEVDIDAQTGVLLRVFKV